MKFRSKLAEGGPGSGVPGHKPGDPVPKGHSSETASTADEHRAAAKYHFNKSMSAKDDRSAEVHDAAFQAHRAAADHYDRGSSPETLKKATQYAQNVSHEAHGKTPPHDYPDDYEPH